MYKCRTFMALTAACLLTACQTAPLPPSTPAAPVCTAPLFTPAQQAQVTLKIKQIAAVARDAVAAAPVGTLGQRGLADAAIATLEADAAQIGAAQNPATPAGLKADIAGLLAVLKTNAPVAYAAVVNYQQGADDLIDLLMSPPAGC